MRLTAPAFLGLALLLLAAPAMAQSGKPIMGSATCRQVIPCSDSGQYISAAGLAQVANACITQNFGYKNTSGFIDDVAGLDGGNCLTGKPDTLQKGAGAQLIAQCCVVKLNANDCHLHCDLFPQ